jgi:hypothetical protein
VGLRFRRRLSSGANTARIDTGRFGFLWDGGGAVISPNSDYVLGPVQAVHETQTAEINLRGCDQGKLYFDTHRHYARLGIFELRVNTRADYNVRFMEQDPQA